MFLPFLEEARIVFGTAATEQQEAVGDLSKTAPPASSQGFQAGLNELLSSLHLKRELLRNFQIFAATVGNTCQFPQSWSFPSLSHEGNSARL